jgi:tRNA 5-methylaminomethyl-2-thiouridine biosynthesis bifunctional protein
VDKGTGIVTSPLFSKEFDDVYFSTGDGLQEKRHVFLDNNYLTSRWNVITGTFTIIETGFGTGLNFFAAMQLWQQSNTKKATLHYISIEKYPLGADDIKQAMTQWPELEPYVDWLIENGYSPKGESIKLINGKITLTLLLDDINNALPKITDKADAWFLDGFAPSKNPDMWSDNLYQHMRRLSSTGSTFATYTSAGAVRRGLIAHGFTAEKATGFGKKRDMLRGFLF